MDRCKSTYTQFTDQFSQLTRIEFSVYGNNDIQKYSAIKDPAGIRVAEVYNYNEPVPGGVIDRRLGVTDHGVCETCSNTRDTCPGHHGHITLAQPVFHIGFLGTLRKVMSSICLKCKKIRMNKTEEMLARLMKIRNGKDRFKAFMDISAKVHYCQRENYGCATPAHKVTLGKKRKGGVGTKDKSIHLIAEIVSRSDDDAVDNAKRIRELTPRDCYEFLRGVSDDEHILMGYNPTRTRLEDLIIRVFIFPSVQIRPSIKTDGVDSNFKDDDLTHKLLNIVKSNEQLKESKGEGSLSDVDNTEFTFLQLHIVTFYTNDQAGLPVSRQKNAKVTVSVTQRIKSKEGRIRGNLMGKRVDMSARSVITSDPNVSIGEVGVPIFICKKLTYPEVVNSRNIARMQQLVHNRSTYPGAVFVRRRTVNQYGSESIVDIFLASVKNETILEIGDVVERHLQDGDIILFNRQPSLHKLSMMGHRVRALPGRAFRLNVNVTDPYGADFDGDEMNLHAPQSPQAVVELRLIAYVGARFISSTTSNVAINIKQDSLTGAYLLMRDESIDWMEAADMLMLTSVGLRPLRRVKMTGRRLFSEIIPKQVNMTGDLTIVNGQITGGDITKGVLNRIVHRIWIMTGPTAALNFVDDTQKLLLVYLARRGVSVSARDIVLPVKMTKAIYTIIESKRKQVWTTITEHENDPYAVTSVAYETGIRGLLSAALSDGQAYISKNLPFDNAFRVTISSGSSGSDVNYVQILGYIGQVLVSGERIPLRFNDRSLICFSKYDNGPDARGFCTNSFSSGLTTPEYFFQAMAGREGNIGTSIKTAVTGYTQRRLVKSMEDQSIAADGTVRNASGKILQFVYGDSGIHPEMQNRVKIHLMDLDNAKVAEHYLYSQEQIDQFSDPTRLTQLNQQLHRKLLSMRDAMRRVYIQLNSNAAEYENKFQVVMDLDQVIAGITARAPRGDNVVDPIVVLQRVREMYTSSQAQIIYHRSSSVIKRQDDDSIKLVTKLYLYSVLAPKQVTHYYRLNAAEFQEVVTRYLNWIQRAWAEPGEMTGILAAQGNGEPITQLNLKGFQKAGTGFSIFDSLRTVDALMGARKDVSKKGDQDKRTKIHLLDQYDNPKTAAKIAAALKYTVVKDVVEKVEVIYDPHPADPTSIMHRDKALDVFEVQAGTNGCQTEVGNLPWVIRMVLSKEKMVERNVEIMDIKTSICHNWKNRAEDLKGNLKEYKNDIQKVTAIATTSNDDNDRVPVVHVRFNANNFTLETMTKFMRAILDKFRIKGCNGITSATVAPVETLRWNSQGAADNPKRHVITATGINWDEMIHLKGIDTQRSYTNSIWETMGLLGIEASRTIYIQEFTNAIDSAGGADRAHHHIQLLADTAYYMGTIISVDRNGISKQNADVLSRASFEKTMDQFVNAALFAENDFLRSVSSRLMAGMIVRGGTGAIDLLLDIKKIITVCKKRVTKSKLRLTSKVNIAALTKT